MKGFCKIIELEHYDVVVIRSSDDEHQEHITVQSRFEGASVVITYTYEDDEKAAINAFGMMNKKECQKFIDGIESMMKPES
jgi:uncharacterized lipoprotein YehR (DUF1307 family)